MRFRQVLAGSAWLAAAILLVHCGSSSSTPTSSPTPVAVTQPSPTPTPTPTPVPTDIVLPAGMTCNPTPPPLLRMEVNAWLPHGDGVVLDSKPLVPNIDHYCDRVGFGDWKFCETRPEGDPERVACDYLATGKADNGRWGPTWIGEGKECGADFSLCALHPDNQFLAIAKGKGEFKACASERAPVAANGNRCGILEYY
jgi:hypothetical protein